VVKPIYRFLGIYEHNCKPLYQFSGSKGLISDFRADCVVVTCLLCRVKRRNTAITLQNALLLLPPLDEPSTPAGPTDISTATRGLLFCY